MFRLSKVFLLFVYHFSGNETTKIKRDLQWKKGLIEIGSMSPKQTDSNRRYRQTERQTDRSKYHAHQCAQL